MVIFFTKSDFLLNYFHRLDTYVMKIIMSANVSPSAQEVLRMLFLVCVQVAGCSYPTTEQICFGIHDHSHKKKCILI